MRAVTVQNIYRLLACLGLLMLTACNRYQITLNDQPVYTPPALFTSYSIEDSALATCVSQAIVDQNVRKADQLTQLDCSFAGVEGVSGLEVFTGLKRINLSNNQLQELSSLFFLDELTLVNLENNPGLSCAEIEKLQSTLESSVIGGAGCQ